MGSKAALFLKLIKLKNTALWIHALDCHSLAHYVLITIEAFIKSRTQLSHVALFHPIVV